MKQTTPIIVTGANIMEASVSPRNSKPTGITIASAADQDAIFFERSESATFA